MCIRDRARKARLEIKSNDTVFPITEGIDFLGYVTRPDHVRSVSYTHLCFIYPEHELKITELLTGQSLAVPGTAGNFYALNLEAVRLKFFTDYGVPVSYTHLTRRKHRPTRECPVHYPDYRDRSDAGNAT